MDLFAGCGGMTRGFVDTCRFEPIFAVEVDPHAAATYAANFGADHVVACLMQNVTRFPKADVVIGGPPCQGFSPLNRHLVGFERRGLWRPWALARVSKSTRREWSESVRYGERAPTTPICGIRRVQKAR